MTSRTIRIFLLLMLVVSLPSCKRRSEPPPPRPVISTTVEVGKQMPAYSTPALDGSTFDVTKERGNVVLLNLWATWCGPCRYEIPELQQLYMRYAPKGFKVIGVSVDEGAPADVKQFVADEKMTYPVVLDPDGKLATLFETTVLPTSAIIDRRGKVIWKSAGIVTTKDLEMLRVLENALRRR